MPVVKTCKLVQSVSKSYKGQPQRAALQNGCDHTMRRHLLHTLLDTQLSSRHEADKGPGIPGQFGVGGLSHSPILETAFLNTPVRCAHIPIGAAVLQAVRGHCKPRDEQVEKIQTPLYFCPCLYYFPSISPSFCISPCSEKIPFPIFPIAGVSRGGPSWWSFS